MNTCPKCYRRIRGKYCNQGHKQVRCRPEIPDDSPAPDAYDWPERNKVGDGILTPDRATFEALETLPGWWASRRRRRRKKGSRSVRTLLGVTALLAASVPVPGR